MTNGEPSLHTKISFLREPAHYPEQPSRVEVMETHMSWVFLTDRHVYKLHKPIRTDYLDFSTLEKRRLDCEEEIRLNRRLAPGVYLGVVALTQAADGNLALEGKGKEVEWLVKMRRLPQSRMLDQLILHGEVDPVEVEQLTGVLLDFYRESPPEPMEVEAYRLRFTHEIRLNHQTLLAADRDLPEPWLEQMRDRLLTFLDLHETLLAEGACRVIETHGDLRPEHICLTDPPLFIDRLEFNRTFRLLDPVEELAFLALECELLGAAWIGEQVLESYRKQTGEKPSKTLEAFYRATRAHLRARLSASHLTDHPPRGSAQKWLQKTQAYLELVQHYLPALSQ